MSDLLFSRIFGTLAGVAVGDALGFPLHDLPAEEIRQRFDGPVEVMVDAFEDDFIHIGFGAGQVTDDTILTIQTALAILSKNGRLTASDMASWLGEWAKQNKRTWYEGEVFGPSTKGALHECIRLGPRWQLDTKRAPFDRGASNGCVMRVAPAGLIHPGRIEEAVDLAFQSVIPTHGTHVAISAASAHAAGIATAITEDAEVSSVVDAALKGARLGEKMGRERARVVPSPSVEARMELAVNLAVKSSDAFEAGIRIQQLIGTNLQAAEAFPAAIGIFVAAQGDPRTSMLAAVNTGGDTDTIASIVGALTGALRGIGAIPSDWLRTVEEVNNLELENLSERLCILALKL